MESIGKTLMEARMNKGLSLREVEELTKIRSHYLQALEEDNFSILPGHTYVLGFIRTYARALGLDPQVLSDVYKATSVPPQQEIKPREPVAPAVGKNPRSLSRGLVIAGLCGLALLTLFGVDSLWKKGQTAPPTEPVSKPPLVSNEQNNQTQQPQQPQQPQTPAAPTTPQQTTPQPVTDLSLDIKFVDRCWLIVNVDGQKAFAGIVAEGIKNFTAKDKIELVSVGNAGAVQLTLNGKALPPLGENGKVVRNKIFTKTDIPQ